MTQRRPKIRLYVSDALGADASVVLSSAQAHYLGTVMRVKKGGAVALFNGRDGEWEGEIGELDRKGCRVSVVRRIRPQAPEPGPWLAFAPLKKRATDFIVEKATELGAAGLSPVFTRQTNSQRIRRDRILASAVEAAEQCGRLTVPEVADPVALDQFIEAWPRDHRLLVLDEHGGGRPITQALADVGATPACGILSGPEGGFTEDEIAGLRRKEFVIAVGLGPRILRAETAALSALACWQALVDRGR